MHNTPLEAKIAARNKANTIAMELYHKLAPIFSPYVGKKIENVGGSLVAKLAKEVETILNQYNGTKTAQIYRYGSKYSILYVVKVCEVSRSNSGDYGHGQYVEESVYIADMSNGVMTKLLELLRERKTNFTAEEINAAREEVKTARAVLQAAESKLAGFGEYDQ